MAEVFINYRTRDGDEAAEHIAAYLTERFGKEHVFKASRSLQPGDQFPLALIGAAQDCDVLLAIMGPDWSVAPQLEDEADWVRKEILAAISSDARVVPVLKGRKTDRLSRASLPPELKWLADVHSLRLDMHQSATDLAEIGDFLAELLPALRAAERGAAETETSATHNSTENSTGNLVQGRDFTGDIRNFSINETSGPTMAGDHNTQHNLNVIAEGIKRLQPLRQPIDDLRRFSDRFVPPPGFAEAEAAMRELKTVVLDGPPGSGRTAAAQMLAFGSRPSGGTLHELEPRVPNEESSLHLDPALIGRGDSMWADCSDVSPLLWNQLQKEIAPLHQRVQECDARLVIIQPHDLGLPAIVRHRLRHIQRPSQVEVFSRLLQAEGLASGPDPLPLPDFLEEVRSMGEIWQFVEDILSAKEQRGGQGDLSAWIAAAQRPTSPRETLVSEALGHLQRPPQRALLLSVAMLHGAHADVIDRAASNLLARLPGESDGGLEVAPLGERLRDVGAETDTGRRVHFTRSMYTSAVPLFFWRHFPEMHEKIAGWVREILDSDDLSDDDRAGLAGSFARQCLDERYQVRWTALVRQLTSHRPNSSRELAAAAVLVAGLGDETSGRRFRRQIYDWATARDVSESLATVLVVACQQMTQTHPGEALVRLHHLARRHSKRTDIWDALANLVHDREQLLRLLLARITDKPFERTLTVDALIFLHVTDPARLNARKPAGHPLIAQADAARQLAAGWTLVYTRLPSADWSSYASDWLSYAAENDDNGRKLVDVLVEGARLVPAVLPQLYWLTRHAAGRDEIAERVLDKISAIQEADLP